MMVSSIRLLNGVWVGLRQIVRIAFPQQGFSTDRGYFCWSCSHVRPLTSGHVSGPRLLMLLLIPGLVLPAADNRSVVLSVLCMKIYL